MCHHDGHSHIHRSNSVSRPLLVYLLLSVLLVPSPAADAQTEATPELIGEPRVSSIGSTVYRVGGLRTEEALTPLDRQWRAELGEDRYDPASVIPLDPGEPLRAELRLQVIDEDAPTLVRMYVLLDYHQIPFSLIPVDGPATRESSQPLRLPDPLPEFNSEDAQPTADITVPSADVVNFLMVADAPALGVHDLTVVFVPDADIRGDEINKPSWYNPTTTLTVAVGDAPPPSGWPTPLEPLDPNATRDPRFPPGGCFLTLNPERGQLWAGREVAPGETLNAYLHCSISRGKVRQADGTYGTPEGYAGAEGDEVPIIFLGFLDDRGVPIATPETPSIDEIPGAIVGTVPLDVVTIIPIQVQMPDEPGSYSFFVHRFPTPYAPPVEGQGNDLRLAGSTSTQRAVFDVVAECAKIVGRLR